MDVTIPTIIPRLHVGQLRGLWRSSGPSQSTSLGSAGLPDALSSALDLSPMFDIVDGEWEYGFESRLCILIYSGKPREVGVVRSYARRRGRIVGHCS
jgi:hypothetical protein